MPLFNQITFCKSYITQYLLLLTRRRIHLMCSTGLFKLFGSDSIKDLKKHGNTLLCKGSFGEISIALANTRILSRQLRLLAVKTLPNATLINRDGTSREFCREVTNEVEILRFLQRHPHIVNVVAVYQPCNDITQLDLAFEYCPIDLCFALEWRRRTMQPRLPFQVIFAISNDLVHALEHCHKNKIVHRDVKPGNLIVSSIGVVKLCDFGLSYNLGSVDLNRCTSSKQKPNVSSISVYDETLAKGLCTLNYRPPEILLGGTNNDPSVDIFSAGVVIAETLLGGKTLFPGINDLDQLSKIFSCLGSPSSTRWPDVKNLPHGNMIFPDIIPKEIDEYVPKASENHSLADFLQRMLIIDPSVREKSEKLVDHDWLGSMVVDRDCVMKNLIHESLKEPWLLSNEKDVRLKVSCSLAMQVATDRRNFTNAFVRWKN